MDYYITKKKKFKIISYEFNKVLKNDKFILLDGGAAGGISEPFNSSSENIQSVRFEPRGKDEVELSSDDIFIDGGLWDSDCVKTLHIGKESDAASICEPNKDFLKRFDDRYGYEARKPEKKIDVKLRSIDSCVSNNEMPLPNFIKLDIHSAELPALNGASKSLDNCVGLLIETWNSEVHKSQGLHHEVEKFLIDAGYEVFDNICGARWKHKFNEEVCDSDNGQYIGSEILFIKKNVPKDLLIKKAFCLSLFKFGNEAKNTLNHLQSNVGIELIQAITKQQNKNDKSFMLKLKKIYRTIKKYI